MESETTSKSLYPVTLKFTGLSYTLNRFFLPMHDFVTTCISHLENIGSLNNADLPNVDIFHYLISKITHSLISLQISSKKSLNIGKPSSIQWQIQVFQNSNFLFESTNIIGKNYCQFSQKWQAYFFHFHRNVCRISKSQWPLIVGQ